MTKDTLLRTLVGIAAAALFVLAGHVSSASADEEGAICCDTSNPDCTNTGFPQCNSTTTDCSTIQTGHQGYCMKSFEN